MLTPLAQASSDVSHWIDAVDAAGAAIPLADPMFKGTLFVPDDKVSGKSYRLLDRAAKCLPRAPSDDLIVCYCPGRAASMTTRTGLPCIPEQLSLLPGSQLSEL